MPRSPRRPRFDLVDFERPPVAEVILATQFAPDTVDLETYGRFAELTREELPRRSRQPLVPAVEETFGIAPTRGSLEIRLEGQASLPRITFASEDGVQLVQLQPHRLTLNWRRQGPDAPYPRYEQLRKRLRQLLRRLTGVLDEVGQEHAVNLSQVTYVNPIEYPRAARAATNGGAATHPDLAKIVNRLRSRPRGAFLPEVEDAELSARWRIPADAVGASGPPVGRLHLAVGPGLKPPADMPAGDEPPALEPIYVVSLTAHVMPRGGTVDRAMTAMDVGHEWVVLGFKDLTTSEMHRHWGLRG